MTVLLYSVCCVCAGFLIVRLLFLRTWTNGILEEAPFLSTAFLLGQAFLANVWLLLGLQSWMHPTVVSLLLVAFALGGFPFAWHGIKRLPVKIREGIGWLSRQRGTLRLCIVASMLLFVLLGMGAFVRPPVGDAEAFYMTYPKIIAASQRVTPMPTYWSFSQVGLMGEMHFAALMQLSSFHAAKFFVWPISLAAAIMLMGVAAETGMGRVGQWFAVIIFLTSTAFTNHITDGKVDLFAVALGIAAFYWALRVSGDRWQASALSITGLCIGFAIVAKLPYVLALLPSVFVLVIGRQYLAQVSAKSRSPFYLVFVAGQLALWVSIAVIPHMVKNHVFFGAPLAPLIGPPELRGITEQSWLPPETTWWVLLTYPVALVFSDYVGGGKMSFLWLAFLLLTPLLPRTKTLLSSTLVQITMTALVGIAVWVLVKPSIVAPRYILATLAMLIPLAARGAEYVYERQDKWRWLRIGLVFLVIAALTKATFRPLRKWPMALLRYAEGSYSHCHLAEKYCPSLTRVNQIAAPGARIYFAGYYGFWLRDDLLQCRQTPEDERSLARSQTGEARWTSLFERGFRYLVIDKSSHPSALVAYDKSQAPDWLNLDNIWEDSRLIIHEVKARNGKRPIRVGCEQISSPAWDVVEFRTERAGA